ncbi:MAG: hypothetical protein KME52_22210 [Desmonostoc geniculatum HA4340-LM1]|jgi:hypothetical protein|uniref:Uncharacterized protein n=1 Tax=Desmonostoc muscorum LEGE 12446 TaxID=1828758 RepID=A0A8J6ZWF0_DESMC|nr:hypothetical protein [Desmonostoc muscorum]MBD2515364.1 hypothetical protein [Nostoc sp. FACHB-973]MBW4676625.1 hypothetical protein [Desmonostoc geniculatum HA4340-LM1]MBX9259270.1 hypothetical protein [Desmonostoc muscorum CCALA 125]MCF2151077.1 hypothetical protein [Desmonostoc muscorum LEGE 12446]
MKTTEISSTTQENRPTKTKKQSFPGMSIGTPKVPFRKSKKIVQQHELLSDWEHAS